MVERPLQHLHAAERAADRAEQPLDAEVADSARCTRDEVGDREAAGSAARRDAPVAGSVDAGPVVPWQPPSRLAQTTK